MKIPVAKPKAMRKPRKPTAAQIRKGQDDGLKASVARLNMFMGNNSFCVIAFAAKVKMNSQSSASQSDSATPLGERSKQKRPWACLLM